MLEGWVMQNDTMGGRSDTLVNELHVIPRITPSAPAVVTTTTVGPDRASVREFD